MTARYSFLSTPSVPSGIAPGPQINLRATPIIHVVEPEGLRNPYPLKEEDLRGMDSLSNLRVTEHPIGNPPAGACPTGNLTSPPPFLEDATTNTLPPRSPLLLLSTSSSSPSSHHDRMPRACCGVERHQRPRPSSRGGADYLHFSKLTRDERTALKNASSRRVAFAEHPHQIASSSLWTSPDYASPSTTVLATATGPFKRRPPTPRYATSFDAECTPFDDDERDASPESPGFDADVEFEPEEVAQRGREQVGEKERLTIIVPGGKSEAYVSMAFERSCSLSTEGDDGDDCRASAVHRSHDMSNTNEKTGLKIRIPVPDPFFMLSLRLASSCRVSDEEEQADMEEIYTGAASTRTHTDDDGPHQSQSVMTQDQEHDHHNLNPLQVRGGFASSRSPTPPVAPPPSPAPPEGRTERREARRAALAPYCAIDRLRAVRVKERPCLPY